MRCKCFVCRNIPFMLVGEIYVWFKNIFKKKYYCSLLYFYWNKLLDADPMNEWMKHEESTTVITTNIVVSLSQKDKFISEAICRLMKHHWHKQVSYAWINVIDRYKWIIIKKKIKHSNARMPVYQGGYPIAIAETRSGTFVFVEHLQSPPVFFFMLARPWLQFLWERERERCLSSSTIWKKLERLNPRARWLVSSR